MEPNLDLQQALNAAAIHYQSGRMVEAESACHHVLAHNLHNPGALFLLGMVGYKTARFELAVENLAHAVALNDTQAFLHAKLGKAYVAQGQQERALACFYRALELDPNFAEAHTALGAALQHLKRLDEALACYQRALALEPHSPEAHYNLGGILQTLDRLDAAAASYQQAIALKPEFVQAHDNLATLREYQGRLSDAIRCVETALAIDPANVSVRWNLGIFQLLSGDFAAGWKNYEMRWHTAKAPRRVSQPQWKGEPLRGRRILLHSEQGLGDTLQFLRYVPMVAAAGGTVLLNIQRALLPLAQQIPGVFHLSTHGDTLPTWDLQCPLMSLPLAFGTTVETIPAPVPYLHAPEDALRKAAALDWPTRGLRVGLVWSGNPENARDRLRSISFSMLAPLLETAGVHFFSLQIGPTAAAAKSHPTARNRVQPPPSVPPSPNLAPTGSSSTTTVLDLTNAASNLTEASALHDLAPAASTMADTAAVLQHLDLLITVDTSLAHLAGALGRPVWLLLSAARDWRWMMDREDSPWYPTMRLFRQQTLGDWPAVIAQVKHALEAASRKNAAL